jgi:hypothetical protein
MLAIRCLHRIERSCAVSLGNAITAVVTLLGVFLGGWLSTRNQERLWHRDHARQWRDIRLSAYNDFLAAYRQYFAFVLDPAAKVTRVERRELPDEPLPYFDEHGRPYKERMDAALMVVRLVSEHPETLEALNTLVMAVRAVALARSTHAAEAIPQNLFNQMWAAQQTFLMAAREELGLPKNQVESPERSERVKP